MNRMTPIIILFTMLTATAFADDLKIGVFDWQRFKVKSSVFKEKRNALDKRFQSTIKKIEQERNALRELEDEFLKQRAIIDFKAPTEKMLEIDAKRRLVKFIQEDYSENLKSANMEFEKVMYQDITAIIRDLAKKENLTVVWEKGASGLLWSDDALDITEKIIELYDQAILP